MQIKKILSIIAFPLFITALALIGFLFREPLYELFSTPERLRSWISSFGFVWLVFVGIQTLQVVVFFIPGEVPQIAGGFLFGVWPGSLLSLVGIIIGSIISFLLARLLGIPFVYALLNRKKVDHVRKVSESPRAKFTLFLFFLIPGIPKDILCYAAGLTPIKLYSFLIISTLGRIPGILGSAMMGDAAAEKKWILAVSLFVLAVLLFIVGLIFRKRIEASLDRFSKHV